MPPSPLLFALGRSRIAYHALAAGDHNPAVHVEEREPGGEKAADLKSRIGDHVAEIGLGAMAPVTNVPIER